MPRLLTLVEFLKNARAVHGDKYDYSKVIFNRTKDIITIICKIHGEFQQIANSHTAGCGCRKCGFIATTNAKRKSITKFIEDARRAHGDKYDYSKVQYINAYLPICIICKIHGDFLQGSAAHTRGNGCKDCANILKIGRFKYTTEEFIEKAKDIHGDKFNYSLVNYQGIRIDVAIICKIHNIFYQKPINHLLGHCCPLCKFITLSNSFKKPQQQYILEAQNIHKDEDENPLYDYSQTKYENTNTKVDIICKVHGVFSQNASSHLKGFGCARCSIKKYSKKAILWLEFISKLYNINIQHARNENEYIIPNTNWSVDGYCQETNTIYEFHGDYWHGNPKKYNSTKINSTNQKTFGNLYQATIERENQIKFMSYNLIVMWEYDWERIIKSIIKLQRTFRQG